MLRSGVDSLLSLHDLLGLGRRHDLEPLRELDRRHFRRVRLVDPFRERFVHFGLLVVNSIHFRIKRLEVSGVVFGGNLGVPEPVQFREKPEDRREPRTLRDIGVDCAPLLVPKVLHALADRRDVRAL